MFGFRLTPDAKHWRQLWSIQAQAAALFFTGVASVAPMLWGGAPFAVNHPFYFAGIIGVLNSLGILGRVLDQPNVPD
jgi:hypothetical protein